jgi:hypothetical protein
VYYLRHGIWPTPEQVEPGAERNRYAEEFGEEPDDEEGAALSST